MERVITNMSIDIDRETVSEKLMTNGLFKCIEVVNNKNKLPDKYKNLLNKIGAFTTPIELNRDCEFTYNNVLGGIATNIAYFYLEPIKINKRLQFDKSKGLLSIVNKDKTLFIFKKLD